ncbi:gas vesicle protein [Plantactinospora sp. BC1]|nr:MULTISPECIES: gas vesicle protein GvpJ [unclassified Plantactinospora]AVT28679.1 gas vesicle protein [Plantactinospora sp. BC1]AVT38075.1 gas vesicle protein [Plantactinospora sp. BB1]
MTVAAGGAAGGGALERSGGAGGMADVVETVLDKGVVIDAQVAVGVVGIPLLEINARVVVASIETYLRFAEIVDRLDLSPAPGDALGGLVENVTDAAQGLTAGLAGVARELGDAAGGPAAPARRTRRENRRR